MIKRGIDITRPWWECLDEEQARDPMGALYDAERAKEEANDVAKEACAKEKQWAARIEFLRGIIKRRIG